LAVVFAGAVVVLGTWPITLWLARSMVVRRLDLPADQATSVLSHVGLPPETVQDFCYRRSPVGVSLLADFNMNEEAFLRWLKSQGWTPQQFANAEDGYVRYTDPESSQDGNWTVSTEVFPVRLCDTPTFGEKKGVVVRRGYVYFAATPDDPDSTTRIIYDLHTSRVYFRETLY
jgi:hypothetical protein